MVTCFTFLIFPLELGVVSRYMMPLYLGEVPIILWPLVMGAKVPPVVATPPRAA